MDDFFTSEEKKELFSLYRHLMQSAGDSISWRDCQKLKKHLIKAAQCNGLQRNNFGMNPVIRDLQTAVIVAEEIGMKGSCLIGIMLHEIVKAHILSYRIGEFPQPSPVICRRYACDPDYDCRPCERNAPD